MTSEDILKMRLWTLFNKFTLDELKIMEDAFVDLYYDYERNIRLDHPATYMFKEKNEQLFNWIVVIRELRTERHGSDTD